MRPVAAIVARNLPTAGVDIARLVDGGHHVHSVGDAGETCESGHCHMFQDVPLPGMTR